MPYPEEMVAPMREELVRIGARELRTGAEVDAFFRSQKGTAFLVVNSVCGCAAGGARPAVVQALRTLARPVVVATVFAGQDLEATSRARSHFPEYPPSSPSVALLKDGKVVHFVPRHMVEGRMPAAIARDLVDAFERAESAASGSTR
jgi:putative YphP/YqiW family bacilliredoxin